MANRMFICSVCYAVMHTFLQGNWWMAGWFMMGSHVRCPARSAVCFSAVLVGTSLFVMFPAYSWWTNHRFLGLCAIWVVDQPIFDSYVTVSPSFCWIPILQMFHGSKYLSLCCWCIGILKSPFDVVQPPLFFAFLNLDVWVTCWWDVPS